MKKAKALIFGMLILGGISAHNKDVFAQDGSKLNPVNMSQGVTKDKVTIGEDEESIINLNGNSVVISEPKDASDGICSIYLDANCNGEVDAGETKSGVKVESADIICGLVNAKTDSAIKITIDTSAKLRLCGVYNGVITVPEGDDAFTLDVKNATIGCDWEDYQTYNSTILFDNSLINGNVKVDVDSAKMYTLYATNNLSSINGNIDMNITDSEMSSLYCAGSSYSRHTAVNGNVTCNIENVNMGDSTTDYGTLYGVYNANVQDVNITVKNSKLSSIYGAYSSGNDNESVRDLKVEISESKFNSTYGDYNCKVLGNFDFNYHNETKETTSDYRSIYGAYYADIEGCAKFKIDNASIKGSCYGFYGNNNYIKEKAQCEINNSDIGSSYGIYGYSLYRDAQFKYNAINATSEMNMVQSCKSSDRFNFEISSISNTSSIYYINDLRPLDNSTPAKIEIYTNSIKTNSYLYFIQGSTLDNVKINADSIESYYLYITNGTNILNTSEFSLDFIQNEYTFMGIYNSVLEDDTKIKCINVFNTDFRLINDSELLGDADIEISGNGEFNKPIMPVRTKAASEKVQNGVINVTLDNISFIEDTYKIQMYNEINTDHTVNMNITDYCDLTNCDFKPVNRSKGANVHAKVYATYGADKYYSYEANLDEIKADDNVHLMYYDSSINKDTTAGNMYLDNATLYIAKNATLGVDKLYYTGSNKIFLEGKIKSNAAESINSGAIKEYNCGGTNETAATTDKYYKVKLTYPEDKMKLISNAGLSKVSYNNTSDYFGNNTNDATFTFACKKGYDFDIAEYKFAGESGTNKMTGTLSGSNMTYKVGKISNLVEVNFAPKPVPTVAKKTVGDPVAKLNETYTKDKPLYDFSNIQIKNDAENGKVVYELVEGEGTLPEGLSIEGNLIIGKATKANEAGQAVTIKVTAKNGSVANVKLNIIVTATSAINTSCEDRFDIDETNKIVDLFGNSVVIEDGADGNTKIYFDDNRNGIADEGEICGIDKNLAAFNIYGLRDLSIDFPLSITVKGGKANSFYGVYNSKIDVKSDTEYAYTFDIEGGKFSYIYPNEQSTITGGAIKKCSPNIYCLNSLQTTFDGCLDGTVFGNNGNYVVNKNFVFKKNFETDKSISMATGTTLTVLDGVNVKAGSFSNSGLVYAYGNIEADAYATTGTSGKIYMLGGTVSSAIKGAEKIYYPLAIDLDESVRATDLSSFTNIDAVNTPGIEGYYAMANHEAGFKLINKPGYDIEYRINNKKYLTKTNVEFKMPEKAFAISLKYLPKQIKTFRKFTDPVAKLDTEYTESNPLYDYTTIDITNDSNDSNKVTYTKVSGEFPVGLELVDGKVIGTPTSITEACEVVVRITGRNGTFVDEKMNYTVSNEDSPVGLEKLSYDENTNTLNLNGTSVVVCKTKANDYNQSVEIFADENKDGIADSKNSYKVDDGFANLNIVGYSDLANAYTGDISITLRSGKVNSVYGVLGKDLDNLACVNGDVTINCYLGSSVQSELIAAKYAQVNNANYNIDGANVYNSNNSIICAAAYCSKVKENVNCSFEGNSYTVSFAISGYLDFVSESTVEGNVTAVINDENLINSNTYFVGINNSNIKGKVDITSSGSAFNSKRFNFVANSTIESDVNVKITDGKFGTSSTTEYEHSLFAESTIGKLNFEVAANSDINTNASNKITQNIFYKGTVGDAYINASAKALNCKLKLNPSDVTLACTVNGNVYSYLPSEGTTIMGNYEITKDTKFDKLIYSANDAGNNTFTVAPTAKLTVSNFVVNGYVVNNGIMDINQFTISAYNAIDNYGELDLASAVTTNYGTIASNAMLINRENAVINDGIRIANSGTIVNYGEFNQTKNAYGTASYSYGLGKIYTTKDIKVYMDYSTTYYYPVEIVCNDFCGSASITSSVSSDVEGDANVYLMANNIYNIEIKKKSDEYVIDKVHYVKNNVDTNATTTDNVNYAINTGKAKTTVYVDFKSSSDVTNITLSNESGSVDNLKVGEKYSLDAPLIDLTKQFDIIGDIDEKDANGAYPTYAVASDSKLPEGLKLDLKTGKIYGTMTTVNYESMEVTINVRGRNQTVANYTLTFGPISKGEAVLPNPIFSFASKGKALSTVRIISNGTGRFEWIDDSIIINCDETKVASYDAKFIPSEKNLANYDWSNVPGWDEDGKFVKTKLSLNVSVNVPEYKVPTGISAYYDTSVYDIDLIDYSDANGYFEWIKDDRQNENNAKLTDIGEMSFRAKYIPDDTDLYCEDICTINVKVLPVVVKDFDPIKTIDAKSGDKVSDIALPEVEGGVYEWVTLANTELEDKGIYRIKFVPNDIIHYDWSEIEGWNSTEKGVVFTVTANVKAPNPGPNPGPNPNPAPNPNPDPSTAPDVNPAKVGTKLTDATTKATYKVTNADKANPEVAYVATTNKKATSITIPETVTIDKVTYKVTSIADKAFAGNKKLKKIKIANNIKVIGKKAFSKCSKLATVTINAKKSNLTTIKDEAFAGCTSLKAMTIPAKVTKLGKKCFNGDKKLKTVTFATTKLKAKSVGANAFAKINAKATIKVPKKQLKAYKKFLLKKGMKKSMKFKKK